VTASQDLPVTVLVITKNEEEKIERCLESVRWAPEVIVVDALSKDQTAQLAERMGARVFQREWPGYSAQKNFGIEQATQPWILSIDADERVPWALAREIQERVPCASEAAFTVRIPVYFLGKELGHYFRRSAEYVRLFRQDCGRFNQVPVHESVEVTGPIGRLQAPLFHDSYPHPTVRSYWRKIHYYSDLEAWDIAVRGHTWGGRLDNRWLRAIGRLGWMLIIRGGLLDGPKAWVWIAGQIYQEWLRSGKATRFRQELSR
jgi:hypothetical protein